MRRLLLTGIPLKTPPSRVWETSNKKDDTGTLGQPEHTTPYGRGESPSESTAESAPRKSPGTPIRPDDTESGAR